MRSWRTSCRLPLCLAALLAFAGLEPATATAQSPEYRTFWVDAWGAGFLNQGQVDSLLGVVGDPNSKGTIRDANCNMVIVQVRRRADVCYPSAMGEAYFSGLSPANYNALQAMINAAHDTTGGKKRIEVHCWLVAFATSTASGTPSAVYYAHNNAADPENYWVTLSDAGAETDDKALDPGHPKCLQYLTDVCMDMVNNFDIDGIHYDYIRFTANNQGYNPTSIARYNTRYGLTGQPAAANEQFKQWRRDQVSSLVRKVYANIQASKPWVKQSGSFVTWNPSPTTSTRAGFQATRPYYDVYSDWDSWMQEGIVDMAVPMTYYNYASLPTDYVRWMNFEKDRKFNRHMIIGPGVYLNSLSNAILELQMTRDASPAGNHAHGFSGYSYRSPYSGGSWAGFAPSLLSQVTPTWADIPAMPWKTNPTTGHIMGTATIASSGAWADHATVSVTGPASRSMYVDGTGFYAFIDLPPGSYTVTASKSGYPNAVAVVNVQVGAVTGNMYQQNFAFGGVAPPQISNVQATSINNAAATITWNTDQAASSQVEYGTTTAYGSSSPLDTAAVTSHSVAISGLAANTLYHYRVLSANGNGSSTSADFTFTTSGPPQISNVQSSAITATGATITWTTNAPANSQVLYGATSGYGSQTTLDPANVAAHSVAISGLAPNTLYHYQAVSANAYGSAQSADFTFTTTDIVTEIVIDNTDAGWSNTSPSGSWSVGSSSVVPKIGTNYLYATGVGNASEAAATRKCRWTPTISIGGNYDVYVYYQLGTNRSASAPYKVVYNGGEVTSIQNQYSATPNQGGWFLIGQDLPFAAGTAGYVQCSNNSSDTALVSADAAKFVLKTAAPPTISQHPAAQSTCAGGSVQFAVTASGSGTLTYQWQKNTANLSNGGHYANVTTATLTVSSADAGDAANYRCVVTGSGVSTTSNAAALTIKAATAITQHPAGQSVCPGSTVQFTAAATGDGTLSYQWQKNGADLANGGHYSGATTVTLTVTGVAAADVATYRCVATGGCGSVTSGTANLSLKTAGLVTQHPASTIVHAGDAAQFSVQANDDGSFFYRWQKNDTDLSDGGPYSGVTTPTLSIVNVAGTEAAAYRCVVTSPCGNATSNAAQLTLTPAADFDVDGDVDGADYGVFAGCFNGTGQPVMAGCVAADFNGDHSVDGVDYGFLAGCFNGSGNIPACTP